jgi:ATP synthase protein I
MSENDGQGGSFQERLKAARLRQGMDIPPSTADAASGGKAASSLGVGMRVGVELVSALLVAFAIGYGLDRWLHTLPLFLVIFVLLGGAAGIANVWRLVGPARHG